MSRTRNVRAQWGLQKAGAEREKPKVRGPDSSTAMKDCPVCCILAARPPPHPGLWRRGRAFAEGGNSPIIPCGQPQQKKHARRTCGAVDSARQDWPHTPSLRQAGAQPRQSRPHRVHAWARQISAAARARHHHRTRREIPRHTSAAAPTSDPAPLRLGLPRACHGSCPGALPRLGQLHVCSCCHEPPQSQ